MAWWGLFVCCPGQEDEAVCESDRVGPGPEGIGSFRWGGAIGRLWWSWFFWDRRIWQRHPGMAVNDFFGSINYPLNSLPLAYLRTKHPGSTRAYCPLRRGRISGAACHAFMCGWQFADGDGNWTRTAYIAGASENQNAQSQKLQTNTDMRRNKNGTEEQWGRKYRWEDRKRVETQLQQIQLMKEGKQNWTNTHGMRNCQNKTGSDMHTETDMSSTLGQRIIRHGSTWQKEETKHRLDTKKGTGMKASNNQKLKLRGS